MATWYERQVWQCPHAEGTLEREEYLDAAAIWDAEHDWYDKQEAYLQEQEEYLAEHGVPMPEVPAMHRDARGQRVVDHVNEFDIPF
jgi:hypothetical protein